ncbi:Nitrogen permease regulator 2 [Ophidiomyces ophidiicola]|nr:Nitrogen permease regulator 2 [Ophidiomyces ophidiicola]
MLKAIFYSKFDTSSGPIVVHQVPDGAVVPSPTAPPDTPTLFNFSDVSFFVIPRQELCGNLIHVCTNGYRILGSPVCIKSDRYDRNEFIFNFCVVLTEEHEWGTFRPVVQKLADLMSELEEQSAFLSEDLSDSGEGKVHSLCETLMEDLNNYCECMLPIDEFNTLNIKLFPLYASPPQVKPWHVPLFTVRYEAFIDENWDLTIQRIVPHVNGVNSVRVIAMLADSDFTLTCRAIRYLVYFGCVFLLDIFSFSAVYAQSAQFGSSIASDEEMQRECARYVNTRFSPTLAPTRSGGSATSSSATAERNNDSANAEKQKPGMEDDIWPLVGKEDITAGHQLSGTLPPIVDGVGLVELYASLKHGQSVKQWHLQNMRKLANIDVRRFITFGVIKGFLYRIHKYPYATGQPAQSSTTTTIVTTTTNGTQQISFHSGSPSFHRNRVNSSLSQRRKNPHMFSTEPPPHYKHYFRDQDEHGKAEDTNINDEEDDISEEERTLMAFLDGTHCFDEICTELQISEKELTTKLKRYPKEVLIIQR